MQNQPSIHKLERKVISLVISYLVITTHRSIIFQKTRLEYHIDEPQIITATKMHRIIKHMGRNAGAIFSTVHSTRRLIKTFWN